MQKVMIDHANNIQVNENDFGNEIGTLTSLHVGMKMIAHEVKGLEEQIQKHLEGKKVFWMGPGMPPPVAHLLESSPVHALLPCYFHWFGTSLCNWVRLIGYMEGIETKKFLRTGADQQTVKEHCTKYVEAIDAMKPVIVWRNKVFAHFSLTDPRKDNAALQDLSVMYPIIFSNNRFRVGGITIAARGGEAELPAWSVTEVYEGLTTRYWPNASLGT